MSSNPSRRQGALIIDVHGTAAASCKDTRASAIHRLICHRAITALVPVLLLLVPVSIAHAGPYVIKNCPAAQTNNFTLGPWIESGSILGPGSFKQTCLTPGDSFGIGTGGLSNSGTAGEEVHTPSSITMSHIKLWWEAPKPISGWSYGQIDVDSPGWSRIFQAETPINNSSSGSGQNTLTELSLPTNTTKLAVAIYCTTSQNCDYSQSPLKIFGSEITLFDSGLPNGKVTGGGLAGAGPVSGSQSLAYEAQDTGSGVRTVELLVDGKPAAKNDYLAECPYEDFAACPTTVSGLISWDTTSVGNGTHEVALRITNAGGNTIIVDDHTITTSNQPIQTSNGSILGALPNGAGTPGTVGIANGESPCAGEALNLTVNGKTNAPVIPYGTPVTVKGVLHCGTVPIRNAHVAITILGSPASTAISTALTTRPDGSFIYKVPLGLSRTLRFSYTAYSNDPELSASATVTIPIAPKIKLNITPRSTSDGHTIYWSGTITPRQGAALEVEVREGQHWKFFDKTIANSKGQFHYKYRFHATTNPTTYTFRVAEGYPYTPSASNETKVHVSP